MATKTTGGHVTLVIRTININLMKNICIDELFYMSLGTIQHENW